MRVNELLLKEDKMTTVKADLDKAAQFLVDKG